MHCIEIPFRNQNKVLFTTIERGAVNLLAVFIVQDQQSVAGHAWHEPDVFCISPWS